MPCGEMTERVRAASTVQRKSTRQIKMHIRSLRSLFQTVACILLPNPHNQCEIEFAFWCKLRLWMPWMLLFGVEKRHITVIDVSG